MGNPVMQFQILSRQPETLEAFYAALFDWKIATDNALGYRQITTGSTAGIDGGIWPIGHTEGQAMVQLFIRVDDVGAHVAKAQQLGATVVLPPQTLPGGDEMAILVDPDGISFAMFRGTAAATR